MARRKMAIEEKKANITLNINGLLINRIDSVLEKKDKRSRLIERLLKEYVKKNKYKLEL